MAHVLASVAAYETEVRQERQLAGIAAAKAEGKTWGGRKVGTRIKLTEEKEEAAKKMHTAGKPIAEIARVLGMTRQTVYRALGQWERQPGSTGQIGHLGSLARLLRPCCLPMNLDVMRASFIVSKPLVLAYSCCWQSMPLAGDFPMNTAEKHQSPVYLQLEAYKESWKVPHDEATCRDLEDVIAVGINIFNTLCRRQQAWRSQVFRGVIAYSDTDNADHLCRFKNWLDATNWIIDHVIPEFAKDFPIEGASELRRLVVDAFKIVSEWQPPKLSAAVGLREMTLTEKSASELNWIMDEAKCLPPEQSSSTMQEMSAGELLLRLKRQAK